MIIIDNNKKLALIFVGDREIELDLDDFQELKSEIIYMHEHPAKEIVNPPPQSKGVFL